MELLAEIRRRARHVIGPVLGMAVIGYFAYHAVHGDRGFVAWSKLEQAVAAARSELAARQMERKALEHRVKLLRPESLDPDLLDEAARSYLGHGHPDEVIIRTEPGSGR